MFEEVRSTPRHSGRLSWRGRHIRRSSALVAVIALTTGASLFSAHSASAAPPPVSQSEGRFLSGSVLGASLSNLLSVTPATAANAGGPESLQVNPLAVAALNAVNIDLGGGINLLGNNGILALGAVNQYAEAAATGSSHAASGAVTDSGGVAVGGSAGAPANATFNLQGLIGAGLASSLTNLGLTVGAVSATANQTAGGTQSGNYQVAGLALNLNSPLVSGIVTNLRTALIALQPAVNGLPALIRALPGVGPLATITGLPNLATVTDALTVVNSADGSITANLQTGAVTIDVAKVLTTAGLDLNNLPPNTQLLPYVTAALTSQLLPALTTAVTALVTQVTNSINSISVSVLGIPVALAVLAPVLNPVITQVVAPINSTAASLGSTVITPLATALSTILSLQGNVQESAGGTFTERALRVGLLPTAPTPVAVLNLASSSVGPNAGALAVPTATSLNPTSGPVAGGQTVTVTGSGFVAGATSVTIGGNTVAAADVTVVSDTSLTFVTPAHAAGATGLTVTTPGGTSAPALTYTYVAAPIAPVVLQLNPDSGPASGGQTVTVTGGGFVAGTTSVTIGGNTVLAAGVTVSSATSLSFPTPAHPAGPVNVTVTTPAGTSSPALVYTYLDGPILPVPPVTLALNPTTGPVAGGQTVTVAGLGFVPGTTSVTIGGNTVPATAVTVSSPTTLTFSTPAHVAGPVGVTVTTPGGTSSPALVYTYVDGPILPVPPVALGLAPSSGPVAGGQTVAVTGLGFVPGATSVTIGGITVPAAAVTVLTPTSLTFGTPAHAAGPVGVTVTTPGGTSSPALVYTYVAGPILPVPPVALLLTPSSGPIAGGQTVTVAGLGFVPGATSVTIGGNTVAATVSSPATLTFTTPAHAAGPVDVTVTTPAGTSSPALVYTYLDNPILPTQPVVLALNPTSGPVAGGQTVTVVGSGYVAGATSVTIGGNTVPAAGVTVISANSLTFTTPAHAAGAVDVTVTTAAGTSSPALVYTYLDGPILPVPPVALSLTPPAGPVAGGQTVAVTGLGFVPGVTSVTIGGTTVPATVVTPIALTFTTPAHVAGAVDVTVTTPAGASSPALVYTYVDGPILPVPPVTLLLSPSSGPVAGGQTVTVTGLGFVPGTTSVTIGGTTIPAADVTVSSPITLTFDTPAHAAGAVGVTVTTPGGTSSPALVYTYLDAPVGPDAPVTLGLSPASGPVAGGQTVSVAGSGFVAGATSVSIGGTTVSAADVTVISANSLTFPTPAHAAGQVNVTVTTPGGTSSPALVYTYVDGPILPIPPIALGLSPTSGPVAGGQTVTVTGLGFVPGTTSVTIGGDTVAATVLSPTSLIFTTPAHAAGAVDVTVTTPGGTSSPALVYTYVDGPILPVPPVALLLAPPAGPVAGGQTVTIAGAGFVAGATSVTIGGNTVSAADVTVTSPLTLTFATPANAAGPVGVTVTTPGGTSSPALVYTYVDGPILPVPPVALLLDPPSGPVAGGQTVTVTGLGFVEGATSVTIGGNTVSAAEVTVSSSTSLSFVTPAHPAGPVQVTVTTANGTSPALPYVYLPPIVPGGPTVTALNPASGPVAGGQTVTVTGTGFLPGLTSVNIGGTSVPATVTSPTSLTFTTPAHAAGPVQVTITTLFGTSDPAMTYTYVAAAVAPDMVGMTPTRGPVAGGQTVTITGTGFVVGATTVTIGGRTVNATVTSPTRLTFTTPAHAAGPVQVTVTTVNGTSAALPYTYVAASVAVLPAAPVITAPEGGTTLSDPQPIISGTGTAGGTVTVHEGGTVICTAVVGADGTWQCRPGSALSPGSHTIFATLRDTAGLESPDSSTVSFAIANEAPVAPSTPPSDLAYTGSAVLRLLLLASVLLALGVMLTATRRPAGRRKPTGG